MENKKNTLSNLMITIALFLVVELVLTQIVLYSGLVWLHHAWSMTELQSNFLFKFGELLTVIGINRLVTKQQLYFSRQFHWLDYAFCFVIILMALPFLPTKDLTTSIAVGLMGGFSEEFLARGVLLGKMTSYFVRKKYSLGRVFAAIFWSNLIFALMHFTNLGQSGLNYVLLQSILAFISGLAFSVIYLQTGSLWYPIALHFMDDFMRTAHDTSATAGGQFGLWALAAMTWLKVGIFIYALIAWRKKKPALVRLVE